jgi:tRNA-modifying protein YgfZ
MTDSVQLTQFEFIRASGPDARTFLQGQVTCDTTKITPTQSVLGALCNLKGRVIADFRAAQVGEDLVLKVGIGLADPVLAVLKKYAVFSKLTLSKEDEFCVLGLLVTGDAEGDTLPASPHAVTSLGEEVFAIDSGCSDEGTRCVELWGNGASIEASAALLTSANACVPIKTITVATTADWTRLEILSGIIHVTPDISGEYTPAQLNYDISGVVNFKKGCYTGQEIVARMFYRSTPKKRLYPLQAETMLSSDAKLNDSASETPIKPLAIAGNAMAALLDTDPSARELTLASDSSVKLAVKEPDYFTK